MRLRLARHGAGADRLRHGLGAALFAQSGARPSWSTRTCWPTTRCSSTPAGSTARWSSTPRTGWPSPSRAWPGSRRRPSARSDKPCGCRRLPWKGRVRNYSASWATCSEDFDHGQRLIAPSTAPHRLGPPAEVDPACPWLRPDRANRGRRALHGAVAVDGADAARRRRADWQQVRLWLRQVFLADRPDAGFLRPSVRQGAGARRRHRLSPAPRSLDNLCEAPDRPARRPHPDAEGAALHQRRPGSAPGRRHRSPTMPADAASRRPSMSRRCPTGASTKSSRSPTPSSTTTRRRSSCRRSTTS